MERPAALDASRPGAPPPAAPLPESTSPERRRFLVHVALLNVGFVGLDLLAPLRHRAALVGVRLLLSLFIVAGAALLGRARRQAPARWLTLAAGVGGALGLGLMAVTAEGMRTPYLALLLLAPLVVTVAAPDDLPAVVASGLTAALFALGVVRADGGQAGELLLWTTALLTSSFFGAYGARLFGQISLRHRALAAERQQAQVDLTVLQELRSAEAAERELLWRRLELLSQSSNEILLLIDPAGRIAQANDRAVEAYGLPLPELLGTSIHDLRAPEVRAQTEAQLGQARASGALRFSTHHRRRDGTVFPVEVSTRAIELRDGRYLQSIVRDVTEERRARAATEYQAMVLENLHDAVIGLDTALAVTTWNGAAEQLYQRPRAEALGRPLADVLPDLVLGCETQTEAARLARVTGSVSAEVRRVIHGVVPVELDCTLAPLRARDQTLRGYVLLSRDISQRRRAERLLRESQDRMNRIMAAAHEGILILDRAGRLDYANPRAAELLAADRRQLLGRSYAELLPEPQRDAARADLAALARGEPARRELRLPRAGDGVVTLLASWTALREEAGEVAGALGFFVDVSEQRRVEQELAQATRLEAVGQLAAGIAHEINTPIQYIGDNTTFLQDGFAALAAFVRRVLEGAGADRPRVEALAAELDVGYLVERIPGTLERTLDGVDRVATIVRAMKEFGHHDQRERVPTDLNRSLAATLEVARNEYKYHADVETRLGAIPLVTCQPGDVNQVFLNLIVNAAHAMADANRVRGGRGVLGVSTALDGDAVVIEISDTGTGIPEAVQPRIFEPFFTTKEVGRGTGQGLAISRSIVTKHGGQLTFTTAVGKGTTFRVRLPIDPPRAERQ